jgi:anti-anti-sigma factor
MKITTSTDGGITVLELDGNLTIGAADHAFSGAIDRLLEGDRTVIVLDMEHVDLVDSTGLGSLVRSHHRCVQAGGEVRLSNIGFDVWRLFEAAQLKDVIPIFSSRKQAVTGSVDE